MGPISSGNTEIIDPRGDLFLVPGKGKVNFQVCSRALARSSRVWDTLLYGPYLEGKGQQKGARWAIPLPEDDTDALRIILFAVHYKFDLVPKTIASYDLFFQLVVLADKYEMVASLKPFWRGWHRQRSESQLRDESPERLIQRLWISHTLGDGRGFYRGIKVLFFHANATCSGELFLLDEDLARDYNLDSDKYLQLLDVLETLKRARIAVLKRIHAGVSESIRSLVTSTRTSPRCAAAKPSIICDGAIFGAFYKAIESRGGSLWYFVNAEGAEGGTGLSVDEVDELLWDVLSDVEADSFISGRSAAHQHCAPWARDDLFQILHLPEVCSLRADQLELLKQHAEKSGLDAAVSAQVWEDIMVGKEDGYIY